METTDAGLSASIFAAAHASSLLDQHSQPPQLLQAVIDTLHAGVSPPDRPHTSMPQPGLVQSIDAISAAIQDHSLIQPKPLLLQPAADPPSSVHSIARQKSASDPLTGLSPGHALAAISEHATNETEPLPMAQSRAAGLPYPGHLLKYTPGAPLHYDRAAEQWQARMRERGWSIGVDGLYGAKSRDICIQFQREKGLTADGTVGPDTWAATFRNDNLTTPPALGAPLRTNQAGIDLIKGFEGFRARTYRDAVGVWTIGYGHTGPDVHPGKVISRTQGEELLKKDLQKFENAVRGRVKVNLNSNQFSALVSFTYNVGPGNLERSTLLKKLNQGDYQSAANEFPKWNRAGGKVLPGLVRRRKTERELFLTPA